LDGLWEEYADLLEANELPPFEKFSEARAKLAQSRIRAMLEVVGQFEQHGEPLVVFSAHRGPVGALADRAGWEVITGDTEPPRRREIVEAFQAGRLKGIALTIRAGGTGLTLTRASTALFVDLDWTPANNLQAEDRLCRIGQEAGHVRIIQMVSDHPLD